MQCGVLSFVRSQVREEEDLVRDVIKAESAAVRVPELDMELGIGTLGGLVTTVEVLRQRIQASGSKSRRGRVGHVAGHEHTFA